MGGAKALQVWTVVRALTKNFGIFGSYFMAKLIFLKVDLG
jgi:hypothetical protein